MKKHLLTLITAILLSTICFGRDYKEAYVVFKNNTLTFYYNTTRPYGQTFVIGSELDDNKVEQHDDDEIAVEQAGPQWWNYCKDVTKVVFDESFKNYYPKSCNYWFLDCKNLTEIIGMKEYLNTDSVADMSYMFNNCISLTSLDLSNFNTAKVTSMWGMFLHCENLKTIIVNKDKWVLNKNLQSDWMFYGCENLYGEKGSEAIPGREDAKYAHIDGGTSNPGYFSSKETALPASKKKEKPYAVLENGVLTFRYDTKIPDGAYLLHKWFVEWKKADITKVVFDKSFAKHKPVSVLGWFQYCNNLTIIEGIQNLNTENIFNMSSMFEGTKITQIDLSGFNTSNVITMENMFSNCQNLTNLDLSGFNTENVTNMSSMFSNCQNLTHLDLSGFNTENVTNMSSMFSNCKNLKSIDISTFNTKNVTNMESMFIQCKSLTTLDLSSFNTASLTHLPYMFCDCQNLRTIFVDKDNWLIDSNICNIWNGGHVAGMFYGCESLFGEKGTEVMPQNENGTFAHIDGGKSNPGYLTSKGAKPFIPDNNKKPYAVLENGVLTCYYGSDKPENAVWIKKWKNDWDKKEITKIIIDKSFADYKLYRCRLFYDCNNLTNIEGIKYLNTTHINDMSYMFQNCRSLKTLDLSGLNTDNITNMNCMFDNCDSLISINLGSINTQNVTSMTYMFSKCQSLKSIDLSNFNTEKVVSMSNMFAKCSNLVELNISGFDTKNVESTNAMFLNCNKLTSLDLSSFNTAKVKNMDAMFNDCTSLKTIYVGKEWTTAHARGKEEVHGKTTYYFEEGGILFKNCPNLIGGKGTKYNSEKIDKDYARIDGGTAAPGYFTEKK